MVVEGMDGGGRYGWYKGDRGRYGWWMKVWMVDGGRSG